MTVDKDPELEMLKASAKRYLDQEDIPLSKKIKVLEENPYTVVSEIVEKIYKNMGRVVEKSMVRDLADFVTLQIPEMKSQLEKAVAENEANQKQMDDFIASERAKTLERAESRRLNHD